jgi:hypothetical protein
MADTILSKKMRAFDGGVALAVAQLYLVRMLQRTLPAGFIAPCLPTKTDRLSALVTDRAMEAWYHPSIA